MNRLPNEEMLHLAGLLTKKLALDLDADDYSSLAIVADLLMEMPVEMVTSSLAHQIGIERCVRHSLDEEGPFLKVLVRNYKASLAADKTATEESKEEDEDV